MVVVPFEGFEGDFETSADLATYQRLKERARHVERLPASGRSKDAFLAAGRWLVEHVDHLIAAWDNQPAHGVGGTADVVAYARERNLPNTIILTQR